MHAWEKFLTKVANVNHATRALAVHLEQVDFDSVDLAHVERMLEKIRLNGGRALCYCEEIGYLKREHPLEQYKPVACEGEEGAP